MSWSWQERGASSNASVASGELWPRQNTRIQWNVMEVVQEDLRDGNVEIKLKNFSVFIVFWLSVTPQSFLKTSVHNPNQIPSMDVYQARSSTGPTSITLPV